MLKDSRIYVALSKKTQLHYCFRFAFVEDLDYDAPLVTVDEVNEVLVAKSQKQLLTAIGNSGVFYNAGRLLYRTKSLEPHKRVWSLEEALNNFENEFEETDAKRLAYEMYLFSSRDLRANQSKSSPAVSFDAFRSNMLGWVKETRDQSVEDPLAVSMIVEPIQDWMMLRNCLAAAASLRSCVDNIDSDNSLEIMGYKQYDESKTGSSVFAIPLKFNTAFWSMDMKRRPLKSLLLKRAEDDPLFYLITRGKEIKLSSSTWLHPISLDPNVFVATEPIATGEYGKLPNSSKEGNRNLYLCVRNSGTQREMADRIVAALWSAFSELRDIDGEPIGMCDLERKYYWKKEELCNVEPFSLASCFFYFAFHYPIKRLSTCARCGTAQLSSLKGPVPEFCSASCRVLAEREKDNHA